MTSLRTSAIESGGHSVAAVGPSFHAMYPNPRVCRQDWLEENQSLHLRL
jgi:hypothetical protein